MQNVAVSGMDSPQFSHVRILSLRLALREADGSNSVIGIPHPLLKCILWQTAPVSWDLGGRGDTASRVLAIHPSARPSIIHSVDTNKCSGNIDTNTSSIKEPA